MARIALGVLFLCAAPGLGQGKTYVVDAAFGPGAHFRDLPAAVAKAVDGDRLVVRRGVYTPFTLNRGVTILGQAGVSLNGLNRVSVVRDLPAGRTATIHNIDFGYLLSVYNCKGRVILDRVTKSPLNGGNGGLMVTDAKQVYLHHSLGRTLHVSNSNIVVTRSRFGGGGGGSTMVSFHRSGAMLAGCDVVGGSFYGNATPAISLVDSILFLTDDGTATIAAGHNPNNAVSPAISGTGTIILDPRVILKPTANAPAIAASITVAKRSVPHLEAQGAPLGGTVKVELTAGARQPYFLAVGVPGDIVAFPSLGGFTWLDLRTAILVSAGRLDAAGARSLSIPVPHDKVLFGLALVWQGTAGPTLASQTLSNPAAYVHGY